MGLFDLFKKNKNIITDNGLNIIYYDNGKGTIKEQFTKTNGLIHGEYVEYDRNGEYQKNEYIKGERCLTSEEKQQKEIQDEINKKVQDQIDNFLVLDNLVSKITHIPHLMQMENLTIEIYTKWIYDKLSKSFDEETIKFYLYSKRNFFIKNYIVWGDETRLNDELFTEIINFYPKRRLIRQRLFEPTISQILLFDLLIDKHTGRVIISEFSVQFHGIDESIFYQDSIFFGLDLDSYKLIHDVLTKSEEKYHKYLSNESFKRTFKDMYVPKYESEETIIEIATNEINLICNNNKINQKVILSIAQDFKQGLG